MKNKDYKFINVKKISGALGATIEGVDLIKEMNDDILKEIKRAFLENLVIFFQNIKFTPEKYLDFAKKFGIPIIYPFVKGLKEFRNNPNIENRNRQKCFWRCLA